MIRSFRDKHTERLFYRNNSGKYPSEILRRAKRKLNLIDAAETIEDLKVPPGNRLEQLSGDRSGQWVFESINNGESVLNGKMVMLIT